MQLNLIPLKIGGIANDGYNIRTFRADRESAWAFWVRLELINCKETDGMRLSEMPEEYFAVPEDVAAPKAGQEDVAGGTPAEKDTDGTGKEARGTDSLKVGNPLVDAARILKLQRMIDEKHFEEADLYGRQLLKSQKLLGLYRNMISRNFCFWS